MLQKNRIMYSEYETLVLKITQVICVVGMAEKRDFLRFLRGNSCCASNLVAFVSDMT